MVLIVPEQSQRPYRFGMTLLCVGALFNWLGLADNYSEPVPAIRYIGVGLIAVGASLICMAMCFWMRTIHDPIAGSTSNDATNVDVSAAADPIHVISVDIPPEKPPDYAAVVDIPPCYEDAIKLNPSSLFMYNNLLPPPIKSNIVLSSDSTSCTLETGGRQPKAEAGRGGGDDDQQSLSQQQQQQNSSHEDNNNYSSFTKVLRKSIREIRKQLRSSSESNSSASHQAPFTATTATTTSTSNASHDHDRNDAEQRSTSDNTCKNSNKEDVR